MGRKKKSEKLKKSKTVAVKTTEKRFEEVENLCKKYKISSPPQFYRVAGCYYEEHLKKKSKEK